jgi:hypothetical protein
MAEERQHVTKPITIIGLEPSLLMMLGAIVTPLNIIIALILLNAFAIPAIVLHTAAWWFYAVAYNARNPDFSAMLAERLNRAGLPVTSNGFARGWAAGWRSRREIYAP